MGYRVVQWTGGEQSGAERLADLAIIEPFDSEAALEQFTGMVDIVTVEFENIPSKLVETLSKTLPVMPAPSAVSICQNREKEKLFLSSNDIPTTAFAVVNDSASLEAALKKIPGDVILKPSPMDTMVKVSSSFEITTKDPAQKKFGPSSVTISPLSKNGST